MREFVGLRAKAYSYFKDNNYEEGTKKQNAQKVCHKKT